ncbi:N-acetylmuramoyl-L-alanine amidase [Xylanibacillus composti]|nr:N-acetylmuramoyl-L-alanine amidase [Xylanibacillus composti]
MKIAIDAGHGPDTPGKRTPDGAMREFQFNQAVARYLREALAKYEAVETKFTHADDGSRDVPLKERTDAANAWGADAFVSIHANAFGDGSWNAVMGIETYVYTTRPKDSVELATAVHQSLIRQTGRPDRGVKAANFHVLRETAMTAILVECEFMTCKESAALLQQDSYRRLCAKAIADGLASRYSLQPRQPQQPSSSQASTAPLYRVQVGAFRYKTNAERLAQQLREQGYDAYLKEESHV